MCAECVRAGTRNVGEGGAAIASMHYLHNFLRLSTGKYNAGLVTGMANEVQMGQSRFKFLQSELRICLSDAYVNFY